jgi:hypothetical protein
MLRVLHAVPLEQGPGEQRLIERVDPGVLRMNRAKLLSGGTLDPLADLDKRASLFPSGP